MKNIINSIFLLSCILIFSPHLFSQSKKEIKKAERAERKANTFKYRSPIMVYPIYWAMQDTRTTPGIYRALGGGVAFRNKRNAPKYNLEFNGQFNLGIGRPNYEDGALQYNTQFLFEAHYLRNFKTNLELGVHLAGLQMSRITPALSNSSFASDAAVGIGPSARWNTEMNVFRKDTKFSFTIGIPLISYVNRVPEYGLSFTGTNSIIAPIGRFNKLSFRIDAIRLFKNSSENTINYFYRWEYYGMKEYEGIHKLRVASHQIGFHLWIKRN